MAPDLFCHKLLILWAFYIVFLYVIHFLIKKNYIDQFFGGITILLHLRLVFTGLSVLGLDNERSRYGFVPFILGLIFKEESR
jgi:hypothetical protein